MTKLIIGGVEYQVGELNFMAMERAWPFIADAMISKDPIQSVSASVSIVAAAVMEEEYFKEEDFGVDAAQIQKFIDRDAQVHTQVNKHLKRKLKASEIAGLSEAIHQITKEAGLEAPQGEAPPAAGDLSMETSAQSSRSLLLPDVKEEVGT